MNGSLSITNDIQTEAYCLGFIFMGIASPQVPVHYSVYERWLQQERHGAMAYLETDRSRRLRRNPELAIPATASILSFGYPYPGSSHESGPGFGRMAAYSRLPDYHLTIIPLLEQLSKKIEAITGREFQYRAYTDTGPFLERDLGMQAGLGWIGKNTCLINPFYGSYFFLAELFSTLSLPVSEAFTDDRCGSCRRCLEACPTGCILPDRTIDARRCISYLTIEYKGAIPPDLRPKLGDWIFGCDICQIICPWNRFHTRHPRTPHYSDLLELPLLLEEIRISPQAFNRKFKTSPVQRARRRGYLRNIAVAMGNSGDPDNIVPLAAALSEESEPLVRGHAAWALGRFSHPSARTALSRAASSETDPYVISEIMAALEGGLSQPPEIHFNPDSTNSPLE